MLKNFLYLNEPSLEGYLSALEGGLLGTSEHESATTGSVEGGVDVHVARAGGGRTRSDTTTRGLADTAHARFDRLEVLASAEPDSSGWVQVLSPHDDMDGIGIGALVDIECEVYVPQVIQALSAQGGLTDALDTMDVLMPFADLFGLDTSNLPEPRQREAMRTVSTRLAGDQVLVGERADSEWRVAGRLLSHHVRGDIEGVARVVGKVSAVWKVGTWKPLLSLPGLNLMSREQRRRLERTRPSESQQNSYLEGPAVMLDLLAVYR